MIKLTGLPLLVCLLLPHLALASDATVGSIKSVRGAAYIIRDNNTIETKAATRVFLHDSLKTGADGSISIIFRDDTLMAIGPNSQLEINEFLFSPGEGKLSFVARLLKGTAACVTGIIGKLSPDSFRFETPVANIGIRGTKFAAKVAGTD